MAVLGSLAFRLSLAMALALLLALSAGGGRPAQAANFAVTKTVDTADGTCDGDCSLREAIIAANAAGGADTVTLPAGIYTLSIAGTGEDAAATGDLDLTEDVTISGAGADSTIIDGGGIDRVFDLDAQMTGVTVEISGVTVRNGNETPGGGIVVREGGSATVSNAAITANGSASVFGGGIAVRPGSALTLSDSTVSGNSARSGGGIDSYQATLTLINVTMSGNTAERRGGGIESYLTTTNLANVTVSGNTVTGYDLPPIVGYGGGIQISGGTVTLANTIVANNSSVVDGSDCHGTIASGGHNLIEDTTDCTITGDTTGNITGADPVLGELADNGGPTETRALLPGSPAMDGGDNTACPATDQRGVARPVDGDVDGTATCDIGAYEYEPPAATPTPTPAASPTPTPAASPTSTPAPAELPPTGGEPASGGDAPMVAILLLVAAALGLAGAGSALAARRQRR